MIQYNTDLKPIVLPEFGRNVQQMVDYCLSIEDREERTRCAYGVVEIMANLFPELVKEKNDYSQIWDQVNIISNFQLDIDFPCDVITKERMNPKPYKIPYTAGPMRYRHYGKSIERMIEVVADMEPGEEKDLLISMIAHHMKKLMLIHNKEGVDDAKILKDLREYSEGRIDLDPATYLLHEFKEATPVNQPKGKKKKK
ncbi:MAG: DUF4290 domain-containing protein [Muribaculaceae bacterium]|nr:DUF4290 domain-containing protein [Bacteroidales bacterium]MBD5340069.1 DUF4290 domain-containing protein [Bacteroides sp.]MDE6072339.1 DUF4290 domain-containing protein [Muribaculaceae bacterium]